MIFETLYDSAKHNELILIDGGYCRFHLRRDNQITIYEIISMHKGAGTKMLNMLINMQPQAIVAKCPCDLPSNGWYQHKGFVCKAVETTSSGRKINVWELQL
jgi:hypothetical protein